MAVISSSFLCVLVLVRNPWRRTHHAFAILSLNLTLWAVGVLFIIQCHTEDAALFWIKTTFIVASFLPATFCQFMMLFPYQRIANRRWVLWFLYLGAGVMIFGVNTPWYIASLEVFPQAPPVVRYGLVFKLFSVLAFISVVYGCGNAIGKLRTSVGLERRQVHHVLVSCGVSAVLLLGTNIIAPVLHLGSVELLGPCFIVLMMAGLAYSMIRYHLLDIWFMVSRTSVYAVVMSCVIITFMSTVGLTNWLSRTVFSSDARHITEFLSTALGALIVVIIIQPIKERTQLFLDRILLHRRYDSTALLDRINRYVNKYVDRAELMEKVVLDISQTIGITSAHVLLVNERDQKSLKVEYTSSQNQGEVDVNHEFFLDYINKHDNPVVLEQLTHSRLTPQTAKLATNMAEMGTYLLIPMKSAAAALGLIAFGQKNSRDIYTQEDEEVLSSVTAALVTAIEKNQLFTKVGELHLHLERIMSSMHGAVIAIDTNGVITTINTEAKSLLGGVETRQELSALDPKVAEVLQQTLKNKQDIPDVEMNIHDANGTEVPVVVSASCIETKDNEILGAMVLIYNMTQIKDLESNVHRADRLQSIGTLAAGMAHEIKNPLQSIKTFTQLLLERYDDKDFRQTFAEVVPPEVSRIDTIVTRLLHFSRPSTVRFAPQDLRLIIENVLALVKNQLRATGVELETAFPEEPLEITADEQQLHQVFLNLVLNAIQAMRTTEERHLKIHFLSDRTNLMRRKKAPFLNVKCIRVCITDTGVGIPKRHMNELFTPFFTTKEDGSGLGLSVVHGIVTEHEGEIDVKSIEGKGSTFTVTFPLEVNVERVSA
jgi:PAS domain S-box-containing protein